MRRNTPRPFLWAKEQSIHLEKTSQKGASWQIRIHLIALKLISRPCWLKLAWQSSKRSELADVFQVVPSQINYVIKTRFYRESRGYIVESKRGGGGYIRIGKVQFSDHHQMLQDLAANIGETISQQVFNDILQMLYEEKLLTQRETQLLLATTSDEVLGRDALILRASMLKKSFNK